MYPPLAILEEGSRVAQHAFLKGKEGNKNKGKRIASELVLQLFHTH